jgi:pimeloyl-ACP methyl ester carboxylesterase
MRAIRHVLLVLLVTLLALAPRTARNAAANGIPAPRVAAGSRYLLVNPPTGHRACIQGLLSLCRAGARLAPLHVRVGPARLPASASSAITPAPCPDQGAVCGTVPVPLDRAHPANGTIPIFFELFTHTAAGPAQSAILPNFGGGAASGTVSNSSLALFFFSVDLDVHDLLLIDDRGRGYSQAINCPALQHGTEPLPQAESDCAAQLGQDASRYGTGDIAQDTEAVRAALGYDKVDYFGLSSGGQDVAAYATRFGAHLRSIVMDAPYGPPGLDQLVFAHDRTQAESRLVRLACAYSPTCSADHPDPLAELNWLVGYIQHHPLEGDAYNASGTLVHVRIDETALLFIIHNFTGAFTSAGEMVAAAAALRQGDPAPLLRLGAEGFNPSLIGDFGDPTITSRGAHFATGCVDATLPWDWAAPVPIRLLRYYLAVRRLPDDYFAPFSKVAATGPLYALPGIQCLWWQKPTPSSPVVPPDATYPNVPTLVLSGDMDSQVPLEEVAPTAQLFPDSTLVRVAEAGHTTMFWTQCARNLASQYIETLQLGDTSCARTPETVYQAVGRFPLVAAGAVPATIDPNGNNQIGVAERKVVTVAVAAVTDALERYLVGAVDDHCLRSGSFHIDLSTPTTQDVTLTGCSFSRDVAVSGTAVWGADGSLTADLSVSGPGTVGGTIHVGGFWLVPGPVGNFKVTGQLGGLNVGVLVPEA